MHSSDVDPERAKRAVSKVLARQSLTAGKDDESGDVGEIEAAEYVLFLLAFDTYARYAEEKGGEEDPETDAVLQRGMRLVRLLEPSLGQIQAFLDESLPSAPHKKMLLRAFRMRASSLTAVARRALGLRTVLNRGGPSTMRAVFETNRNLRRVREGMAASMSEDAADALRVFAGFPYRNQRIRYWVRMAAKTASLGFLPKSDVGSASDEAAPDQSDALLRENVQQMASSSSEEVQRAGEKKIEILSQVEADAREAAQTALELAGEQDEPTTRSEVVGIATAAAVAAATNPNNPQNIPTTLKGLDDEQRAAALTDGRVLVAAGAGSGKSTTAVARVGYLVKERRVTPTRIMVTSFNASAANDLKGSIGRTVGDDALAMMSVGTMHSLFGRLVKDYGTPAEKGALKEGFVGDGGTVARTVQRMWEECFDTKVRPVPRLKDMLRYKSQWAGNSVTPATARAQARRKVEVDAADWYELYEGLKGGLPNWTPSCEDKAEAAVDRDYQEKYDRWRAMGGRGYPPKKRGTTYQTFMAKHRPQGGRLADFDDMLGMLRDVLQREPGVRKTVQGMFDHIIIDEAQDLNGTQMDIATMISEHVGDGSDGKSLWIVGDDKQCCAAETLVSVPGGVRRADELKPGDKVLAYRNSGIVEQTVRHVMPSTWTHGIKLTTDSGRTLTVSPNHKIWASRFEFTDTSAGNMFVYMMHRPGFGFRVGITNKDQSDANPYGNRIHSEGADRLWLLEICDGREKALERETHLSLKYGIPTSVFNGTRRGINQDRINATFRDFGKNGMKLLEDRNLSFDLPHWMSYSVTKGAVQRRTVQMVAHGVKGTNVALEWLGLDLDDRLLGYTFSKLSNGRRRLRKYFNNYRQALEFAERLSIDANANLMRRLTVPDSEPLRLLTASSLFCGMSVPVESESGVELEEIVSIEPVDGTFIDLDVDDASNFFGGGILSHNSIYSFRGARPELFRELNDKENWKTRSIRTNYRCEPEIVEVANQLISHNENKLPFESRPNPARTRGVGSVRLETPQDDAQAALNVIEEIKRGLEIPGADISENAILCRTNNELHAYETACIVRGVPYARNGASSFLGSPETTAVLGYVQLALGDDFEKMQKALGQAINKPNRFFVSPDAGAKAVDEAFSEYARKIRVSKKDVDPHAAMRDQDFLQTLAQKLKRGASGYALRKTVEDLEGLADAIQTMQANSDQPGYATTDLFDEILSLKGTTSKVNADTGRTEWVEESFRESLQAFMRDAVGDDSDDDEGDGDSASLGNISFLFKLAEPDPTDPEDAENLPSTPKGFKAKIERLASRMRDLRIDYKAWQKKQEALPPEERKKPPAVVLATVHATKGAQWPNTYVQMPRGKFPIEIRVKEGEEPPSAEEIQGHVESERRLAYVALTRAAKNLTVVCPDSLGGVAAGRSSFVYEAGLKVGENVPKAGTEQAAEAEADAVTDKTASQHLGFDRGYEGPVPDDWDFVHATPWEVE